MVLVKLLAGCVDIAAGQLVLVGEGDGMDQEVEAAPALLQDGEGAVDAGVVADIAGHDDVGASLGSQRLDPLFQRIALDR